MVVVPAAMQKPAVAQQTGGSFALGSGSTISGVSITLPIVYLTPSFLGTGSLAPASAQMTLSYSTSDISSVSMAADPSLASSNKSLACASPSAGTVNCVVYGMNATPLATGVIAEATFTVISSNPSTALALSNALGASPAAAAMPMTSVGGSISITPAVRIQSLACTPATLGSGQSASCTANITGQHSSSIQISIASSSSALTAPAQVTAAGGATTASFSVAAGHITSNTTVQVSASLNGATSTANVQLLPPAQLSSLNCGNTLAPGTTALCVASLNGFQQTPTSLTVSSSTGSIKVPTTVGVRAGQSEIWFNAIVDPAALSQSGTITATLGSATAVSSVTIHAVQPVVTVPSTQSFPTGRATSFVVQASDPMNLPLTLAASNMPAGATFNSSTRTFLWTPTASEQGMHQVTFTATNSQGASGSATVSIESGTGVPFITGIVNAASGESGLVCSPGSAATVQGIYFGSSPTVIVNGTQQPVSNGHENAVSFTCPSLTAGTTLSVQVQNTAGASAPIKTTMQAVTPGVYTWNANWTGSEEAYFAGTATKVSIPDYATPAQSALPGDAISIYATGINPAVAATTVTMSGIPVTVTGIVPVAGQPGNYEINCTVPANVSPGTAVPVVVTSIAPGNSTTVVSNTTTLPIAPSVL